MFYRRPNYHVQRKEDEAEDINRIPIQTEAYIDTRTTTSNIHWIERPRFNHVNQDQADHIYPQQDRCQHRYDRVIQLEDSLAASVCKRFQDDMVVAPPRLRFGVFTSGGGANWDHNPSSLLLGYLSPDDTERSISRRFRMETSRRVLVSSLVNYFQSFRRMQRVDQMCMQRKLFTLHLWSSTTRMHVTYLPLQM